MQAPRWQTIWYGRVWETQVNGTTIRIDRVGRVRVMRAVPQSLYADAHGP